jgi:hypothetical protein
MTKPFPYIALFAAALIFVTACGAAEDRESAPSGHANGSGEADGVTAEAKAKSVAPAGARVEHEGVSIEVPDGWVGRVLIPGVLQAANFELVPVGTELPAGQEDPIKAMTATQALVTALPCTLVSWEGAAQAAPDYMTLDDLTFLPAEHPRVPRGHAFAHGSFDFSGRCVRVEVDFGGTSPGPKLKDALNAILGSLSVAGK